MAYMQVYASKATFANVFRSCGAVLALCLLRLVHGFIVKYGFIANIILESSIVDVYEKCQYLEMDDGKNVVFIFFQIFQTAVRPFNFTFCNALNACSSIFTLKERKQSHGVLIKICLEDDEGFPSNLVVGNASLDIYGKCGNLRRVWFYLIISQWRDSVSWNALLTSYARHGLSEQAMTIFSEMQWETRPRKFTIGTLLAAYANAFSLEHGKQIRGFMIRNSYEMDIVIRGALVDMCSKCRCLEYAFTVFKEAVSRDVILWNSVIFGCSHN
ncbi:pentatricopeptide repeat-containing protein [Quercus suber]|uniref:Pentatricopeptide repeat-containing protein n=1 Tax=Quercus suber TaxID=58331 RepID=A0AAW0KNY5_QUESU